MQVVVEFIILVSQSVESLFPSELTSLLFALSLGDPRKKAGKIPKSYGTDLYIISISELETG